MKILKKILLGLLVLVAAVLILALFTKKDYAVEKTVTIDKPEQAVFDYIKYLKNQDNYSKWATMDANMKKEYKGTDGAPGFRYFWTSEKDDVGQGEQEIVKVNEGESVVTKIHFIKPFDGLADAVLSTTPVTENKTNVKWSFKSRMNYPMNIMLLFMGIEKMVGDDLQTGLNNLKTVLEK